jgi:uncharacterized lipoprotein YajG
MELFGISLITLGLGILGGASWRPVKRGPRRILMTALKTILPALLLTVSAAGCQTAATNPQTLPPRPTLESATRNDSGGICIDRDDTRELMHYLDKLERRRK